MKIILSLMMILIMSVNIFGQEVRKNFNDIHLSDEGSTGSITYEADWWSLYFWGANKSDRYTCHARYISFKSGSSQDKFIEACHKFLQWHTKATKMGVTLNKHITSQGSYNMCGSYRIGRGSWKSYEGNSNEYLEYWFRTDLNNQYYINITYGRWGEDKFTVRLYRKHVELILAEFNNVYYTNADNKRKEIEAMFN